MSPRVLESVGEVMFDKRHYQWIYNDFSTQIKILKAQEKAFAFMKQLGDDVYEVEMSIKSIGTLQGRLTRLDLLDLGNYYYKIANGIGEQWLEVR